MLSVGSETVLSAIELRSRYNSLALGLTLKGF